MRRVAPAARGCAKADSADAKDLDPPPQQGKHYFTSMRAIFAALLLTCCLSLATPVLGAKHEIWFEARSPHFVVVSNAGEKQARKTARQFEQIRSVFRQYILIASGHSSPVITIFAVKDAHSLRALLPEYWATKGHTHPAGIFFYNLGQFEAAVQLDAQGPNPYEAIYHEYYHSLTLPYFPGLPVWLAEGLADFFGNSEINEKEARLGEPDPNLIEELRENRLIPLDVLFKVDQSSPYYNEQNQTSMFYAESWALTHYLMLGDNGSHKQLLLAYLQGLQQDGTQSAAATKALGDLNKLQKDLERYINGSSFFQVHGPAPAPIPDADLRTREISDAEADAYLGGFAALRGHPQEAKPLLEQAIQLDPKLALAYQNLGLMQLSTGQRGEALTSFSQAVELDPKNALTRYLRAYLSFGQRNVSTGNTQIEDDLHQAIALDPDFAPSYGLLAVYLAASNEKLPEALALAQKGVSLEPGNALYALSLAQVLAQMGRFGDAETAARTARANATNPAERANAEQFLAYLQRTRN
jgi:tetratricopeptide (TPR) repeat protein